MKDKDIFVSIGLNIDPYQRLANAIIIQAAKDLQTALAKNDTVVIYDLEHFFRSEWFELLTDLDGDVLVTDIERMYENEHSKTKSRHLPADKWG